MQKAFLKLQELRIEFPDGAIFSIKRVEHVTEGWVVKMKYGQNLQGEAGMIKAFTIAEQTTQTVAAWRDEETEFFDVVQIFEDEEEATKAGLENGQMTIYQIETGKLKWLI